MKKMFPFLLLFSSSLVAMTIEEKIAGATSGDEPTQQELNGFLLQVNRQISTLKESLFEEMEEATACLTEGSSEDELRPILERVRELKGQLFSLEKRWREAATGVSKGQEEGYSLWDLQETTLSALVMEYGSSDYLYVVPPEMGNMKISMHSNIPIPRESWSEVLEIILSHNGVGIKEVNPFTRQLYVFKQDPAAVSIVASSLTEISHIGETTRVFFVFSPPIENVKSAFQFFERFSDPKTTYVYNVGGKIAVVASRAEVEKLVNLYRTVWKDPDGKISRVVPVSKMNVREMEKILKLFFSEAMEKTGRPPFGKFDNQGLSIITPAHGNALILMGSREVVDRAEKVISDTENQLQDPAEMTIYLYQVKHSDPTDLAKVLDKVYYSLLHAAPADKENLEVKYSAQGQAIGATPDGYAPSPGLTVPPPTFKPEIDTSLEVQQRFDSFIPDPKTGNILMVVRRDVLPRLKDLLLKLDVPKRMVQIEVLLFEKKLNNQANYGLNLLKLGNADNGARYDGPHVPGPKGLDGPVGTGVLSFLFSGKKSKHFPAFDFAYSFLMTQEDIQLNAAPSVITVNQTPATISILEEISLNNGAAPIDTNKGIAFEKSFTRAQYGITIIITPIVHVMEQDECGERQGFVTLQTNITFDTTRSSSSDDGRPPVDRRHIENEVRVFDGQTVILGGLRRKAVRDKTQKVPFLGEIPGLGKLFGSTELTDDNTEMFFFITPKIVVDPKEELEYELTCDMERRPGDLPEFLERLVEARACEQKRLFSSSIRAFFGEKQQYYE